MSKCCTLSLQIKVALSVCFVAAFHFAEVSVGNYGILWPQLVSLIDYITLFI